VGQFPYSFLLFRLSGQDSIVSKATCCGLVVSGFELQFGQEIFSSSRLSSLLYNGYQGSFLWVKLLGHGVDHPPPSSTGVKNEFSCTSVPLLCLHGMFWGHLIHVEAVTDVEDGLLTAIFQQNAASDHRFLIVRD